MARGRMWAVTSPEKVRAADEVLRKQPERTKQLDLLERAVRLRVLLDGAISVLADLSARPERVADASALVERLEYAVRPRQTTVRIA